MQCKHWVHYVCIISTYWALIELISVEQPPFFSRVFFQGVNGVQPFTNLVKGMHTVKIFCERYLYRYNIFSMVLVTVTIFCKGILTVSVIYERYWLPLQYFLYGIGYRLVFIATVLVTVWYFSQRYWLPFQIFLPVYLVLGYLWGVFRYLSS